MPLIAYKLILISLDRQRLREIATLLEDLGHTDDALFLKGLIRDAKELNLDAD